MNKTKTVIMSLIGGAFIGFINGFLGAGGGMLLVPFLRFFLKEEEKKSHATAIFIILPICIISAMFYIIRGIFDFNVFLPATIGTLVGGLVGTLLLCKLSNKIISIIFNFLLIGAGVYMVIGGFSA